MFRIVAPVLLALMVCLAAPSPTAADPRPFPETGYSVTNDRFLDFFDHRGGVDALGYPISKEFDFLGTRVQFFQRAVLQLRPDGGVGLLNVLDEGLLPYTQVNGSTFPLVDPAMTAAAPSPAEPDYAARAIEFVRANAPDEWEGLPTNFYSTFAGTVTFDDAFPSGDGDPALVPLINLEMWGLPISRPARDPANSDFVYLRFQRGIMHFDRTSGVTQGILVGDLLKSVITGQNLPPDLEQQARGSRLYRQYDNRMLFGLARPAELPATNLFAAFEEDGVVVPPPVAPSPTPVPPVATATPAAPPTATPAAQPVVMEVTGSPWFVEQTNRALQILADDAPSHYANVRRYIYSVRETTGTPRLDIPARTIYVNEATAFPPAWRSYLDNQAEWYAGLMVHHAVHVEQAVRGSPTGGHDAEWEAYERQKGALGRIDTTENPGGQFTTLLNDVLTQKEWSWDHWGNPRDPGPTATPTS